MAKEKDVSKDNVELSELQVTYVKLATLSSGLSSLFTSLITETDEKVALRIIDKINDTMDLIDNIITEELMEIDLTSKRD
jgi:hypothetical protein